MMGDGKTQLGNAPPSSGAQPSLDDASARGGKPLKNKKIQVRRMQPMSRMVLLRAAHFDACSGSLPHDLINIAVDDVLKRVSEAIALEDLIWELQGLSPGMLVDRTWMNHEGPRTNQSDKGPKIKDHRMEEDVTPGARDRRQPKEYQVPAKKNVCKLRKRPGAAKWVRKLG